MPPQRFSTRLKGYDLKGSTTFVFVPEAVMVAFAPRRRVPVKATVNRYAYRTTIVDMGKGPCFAVNKTVREATGIARDDRIDVTVELDVEARTVDVPDYLAKALGKRLRATFDAMAYSHRKEYVDWIAAAKQDETRARRVGKVIEKLRERAAIERGRRERAKRLGSARR
jgi:uncharacterized protein YdeI (YjbR/CyaY-like superfamily)